MRWKALIRSHSGVLGAVIVVLFLATAALAPVVAPTDPTAQNLRAALRPPGQDGYLLGSDELGRDTLSRIIYGSRISLAIGLASVGFGLVLGVPLGLMAGYQGRALDSVTMRAADIVIALPRLLIGIVIVATWGIGFWTLVMAIGVPDIPVFARLVRGSTLQVAQMEYVTAARALGSPDSRIMFRHIFPNLVGPLTVQVTFSMAAAILTAGGLSFLGLGVRPPTPEWGYMLAQARVYMRVAPHLITYPGVALAVVVLGINLLGDALRQAYDPRFRGKEA
ncbi:MAG: ABC transporter permease [Armatimonadota bacterium]|nr:ABC transporter permease [Armatimonadota bacterium]